MKLLSKILVLFALITSAADAAIVPSIPYNLTNGSLADATQVMGNFNTIVSNVNSNGAHNGANGDITSLTGLTTPLSPAGGGTVLYTGSTTTGSANAQVIAALVPSNFALGAGRFVNVIAGFSNSGAMTLNANSTGATTVDKVTSAGLVATVTGDVIVNGNYTYYYDGTEFILLNPTQLSSVVTGPASATSGDIVTFNGTTGARIQDSGILSSSLAPLASPTFTGTPAAPTAAVGVSTTQLATTAFANPLTSNVSNGYLELPGGTYIEWGTTGTIANNTTSTISFPFPFPNACFLVTATPVSATATIDDVFNTVAAIGTSSFALTQNTNGAARASNWIAVGD